MSVKKMTVIFLITLLVVIIGYDVYAWNAGGTEATISYTIFEWSHKYPFFTFMMGFVCGHLFWQMKGLSRLQSKDE
jgi:hypothetical protein